MATYPSPRQWVSGVDESAVVNGLVPESEHATLLLSLIRHLKGAGMNHPFHNTCINGTPITLTAGAKHTVKIPFSAHVRDMEVALLVDRASGETGTYKVTINTVDSADVPLEGAGLTTMDDVPWSLVLVEGVGAGTAATFGEVDLSVTNGAGDDLLLWGFGPREVHNAHLAG